MSGTFCRNLKMRTSIGLLMIFMNVGLLFAGQAERQYDAQWIWGRVESPKPFQFVRFRKSIDLASRPTNATAYITADTFYRLWINGQLVMHGPARSGSGKATVDRVDVGQYLIEGANRLMVEVFHGVCPLETLAQAPGLLCELEAESNGKREIIASSDGTWESAEITAWQRDSLRFSYQRGWIEQYDARRNIEETWQPAIVLGKAGIAPWSKLEMRDIPLPAPLLPVQPTDVVAVQRGDGFAGDIEPVARFELPRPEWDRQSEWLRRLETENLRADATAATEPEAITIKGKGGDTVLGGEGASVAYDFGLGYVGFIGFEVSGHEGQVLEIAWNERLMGDGATVRPRYPMHSTGAVFNNAIRYTLREGRQTFLAYNPQFVRFLRVVQRGQGQVTLHRLWLNEFRFVAEPKGDFRCSDDQLNHIYDAARRTAMLVTLDAFMDCPHRERNAMFSVEAYWTEKAVFPCFGDTSVSRRSVIYGADSVNDPDRIGPPGLVQIAYPMHMKYFDCMIPTGPLFWVLHAGLYERCSGDTEFMRTMLPVIRRNLAAFDDWRNSEGLLETKAIPAVWLFFDYTDIRTDGISVALNAVYARTLDEAARLERVAGDTAHADQFAKLASQVRNALNRYCPGESFYPDVLLRNDKNELVASREASETTQYFVMWNGVPSPERLRRMWHALRDDFAPTPLKTSQSIQGLARAALYPFPQRLEVSAQLGDHAALLRDIKAMFLPMAETPPGTLWEDPRSGNLDNSRNGALCHSIGCGVAGILTQEVLGIQFGFPLKISPHNGGSLQWCKGFITTPKGQIEVEWGWQPDRYQLQASIPKNVIAEVVLPPEAKAVWQSGTSADSWRETVTIPTSATIVVTPGSIIVE